MPLRPLIVRLRNWVGDVVLGLPMLERLQREGHALQLVGKGWARDLLAGHGWPVHPLGRTLGERVRQLRTLRREALAADPGFAEGLQALVLPYSFSSALEMRLAGLRALGYRHEGRSLLLQRAVARSAQLHEMAIYWELGSALLRQPAALPDRIALRVSPRHDEQALALRRRLGLGDDYVLICPFAGGTFEKLDKCWPGFPRWAERSLPSLGRAVLICPGPGEEEAIAGRDYAGCRIARGVDLGTYAALLRDAALVVSNDTGPGHMAAAVGAPLLSVLGPTDPARWGAIGPTVHVLRGEGGTWPDETAVHDRARALLASR
ncbi:MAG: glycosyltransferase family 9 protein [Rubrivivax sp.]